MHRLLIFVGGGLGSLCRYGVSSLINQNTAVVFPFGTLAVNIAGSFIMGFLFQLFDNVLVPTEMRTLLLIGFLGGFTTFSSYSIETINLLREGEIRFFFTNVLMTNAACLLAALIGLYAAGIAIKFIR